MRKAEREAARLARERTWESAYTLGKGAGFEAGYKAALDSIEVKVSALDLVPIASTNNTDERIAAARKIESYLRGSEGDQPVGSG